MRSMRCLIVCIQKSLELTLKTDKLKGQITQIICRRILGRRVRDTPLIFADNFCFLMCNFAVKTT